MKSDKFTDTTLEKDPNFVNGDVTILSPKQKGKTKKFIKSQKSRPLELYCKTNRFD